MKKCFNAWSEKNNFNWRRVLNRSLIICFILELCLTSNLIGQTVPDLDNHQFKFWYEKQHPCIICVSISLYT